MKAFISTVCVVGLVCSVLALVSLIVGSLAVHDYHVVLTLLSLVMLCFFVATSQVVDGY